MRTQSSHKKYQRAMLRIGIGPKSSAYKAGPMPVEMKSAPSMSRISRPGISLGVASALALAMIYGGQARRSLRA